MSAMKELLKKIPGVKFTYNKILFIVNGINKKRKEKYFLKHGYDVMFKTQQLLESYGCMFHVECGAQLGLFRDNALIGRDMDIDLAVYLRTEEEKEKFRAFMVNSGYINKLTMGIHEIGTTQDSFYLNKINCDVAYYFEEDEQHDCFYAMKDFRVDENGNSYCKPIKCIVPKVESVQKFFINDKYVFMPENPADHLEAVYGKNWMTPDKNYKYWENPCYVETNYEGYVYTK